MGGSFEPPIVGRFALASVISTRRKLRDNFDYRAANGHGLFQKIARLGLRFREYGQGLLKGFYALLPGHGAVAVYCG